MEYTNEELLTARADEWAHNAQERQARAITLNIELRRAQNRVVELQQEVARLQGEARRVLDMERRVAELEAMLTNDNGTPVPDDTSG